jgi:hypothetical protein
MARSMQADYTKCTMNVLAGRGTIDYGGYGGAVPYNKRHKHLISRPLRRSSIQPRVTTPCRTEVRNVPGDHEPFPFAFTY